ncbi:hypothetical protein ACDF64_05045 [Agromyces sp. MMS24-JH15]|uniref:hypothetical protein n=1 Tax=Agromyces sp. MMS24-JH15 TaxID=3243765 RepID=UPI003749A3E4
MSSLGPDPVPMTQTVREPRVDLSAQIPWKDDFSSILGFGPMPFTKIIATHQLVDEANRAPVPRRDGLTYVEQLLRSKVEGRAQAQLDRRVSGQIEREMRHVKSRHARINSLTRELEELSTHPVKGAHGEALQYAEAVETHDALVDRIRRETELGSKRHLARRGKKGIEVIALVIDFPVFLLAMLALFNVNVRLIAAGDLGSIVLGVTALLFALLGTILYALTMRQLGRRHRVYKSDEGYLDPPPRAKHRVVLEIWAMVLITAAIAVVMSVRIITDGVEAEAPMALVIAIALLFSGLIAVSGYLNWNAEFSDGSDETDRLEHLADELRARERRRTKLLEQRTSAIEDAGVRLAALDRMIARAGQDAEDQVVRSSCDRAIRLARSYHGLIGDADLMPPPRLDRSRLELAARQSIALTTHEQHFEVAYAGRRRDRAELDRAELDRAELE